MTDNQTSETRFGLLVQNVSDIITVLALDGTIKYESPSTVRILGMAPEELVGHNAFEFIHPDDIAGVQEAFGRAVTNPGLTVSPEFRFRHANGSWVYLEAVGNNLLNVPEVDGLVVTSRDVTERRALEEQLRQAQKMEAIGQLAGGIAHDFNNMLMIMRGNCELILEHMNCDNPSRRNAESLMNTADRAANLTHRLLTFSRRRVYTPRVVNLDALAIDSANMYRQLLGSEIELRIESSSQEAWVKADPALLEQVMMNLAVNARDAMPDGGKLAIKLATANVDEHSSRCGKMLPPGRYAILSMTDNGIGMDAQTQQRMFEPFFTTKLKGTGLGLAIVYSIIKQSEGHLWATSEIGKGTTFEICLPLVDHVPTRAASSEAVSAPQSGTGTILLAEDEVGIREIVHEFLKRKGYTVIAAKDGLEALQVAESHGHKIDALLTDVIMPRMSGPELAYRLAMHNPDLKVIFMTGHAEEDEIGPDHMPEGKTLLQKPFEFSMLARVLNEVLVPVAAKTD